MPKLPRNRPLTVKVVDDQLVISIGVSTLSFALQHGEGWVGAVIDERGFAEDVVCELEQESETGLTPVQRILDEAANRAAEGGSRHYCLEEAGIKQR